VLLIDLPGHGLSAGSIPAGRSAGDRCAAGRIAIGMHPLQSSPREPRPNWCSAARQPSP
jgi:hypothetical protein